MDNFQCDKKGGCFATFFVCLPPAQGRGDNYYGSIMDPIGFRLQDDGI